MVRKANIFGLMLLAVIIIGATSKITYAESKPSEHEAKKILASSFGKEIKRNILKINKIEKTDGQDINLGIQMYNMYVDVELEFLTDTAMCSGMLGRSFIPAAEYNAMEYWAKFKFENGCATKVYNAGDKLKLTGEILFEKSERGWRNGKLEIKSIESTASDKNVSSTKPSKSTINFTKMVSVKFDGVKILNEPAPSFFTPPIAILNKGVKVEFVERSSDRFWVKVKLPDGKTGWCTYNQIEE